jgi:ribonucleoside-triphosphate reductase
VIFLQIVKRDGRRKELDIFRIHTAIHKAYLDVSDEETFQQEYNFLEPMIIEDLNKIHKKEIDIEQVQNIVIKNLKKVNKKVAKSYKQYRDKRTREREHPIDKTILNLIQNKDDFLSKENANKRPELASTQRDLMAGTISRFLARKMIPKEIIEAHDNGEIKIHDLDYFVNPITNCELLPLDDMFEKGTVINGKMIETPQSLQTAVTLATQIVVQVTSNTYGGCSISLTHLAPYLRKSKHKITELVLKESELTGINYTQEQTDKIVDVRLRKEIRDSIQTLNYQINTMSGQNGQTAFLSIFIYLLEKSGEYAEEIAMLAEEIFNQRIAGMKNEQGICTTQTFPKLLFVLDENNVYPQSKYYWLLKLAMECTAKRQSPDYQSAKVMKEVYGEVFPCMGCRSFLFPFLVDGKYKWYGRMNLGVCTINIPDVALTSKKDEEEFWKLLDYRMEKLVKPMGILRYEKLKGIKAKVAPLLWQHGAFARLNAEDDITDALDKVGFSISIGYTGIYETVKYMTGESHTSEKGFEFAVKVMKYLEDKANQWKEETGLGFSVYSTPQEESTDWFTQKLTEKFGIVEDITDKGYITNSYHVNPHEQIDAFTKLEIEGKLQRYSKGGNVSYIETLGLENNLDAMYEVIKCIYDNNTHAEINSQSDCVCYKCGYKGKFENDKDTLEWICPNCKNQDQSLMSIVLRVCGYLSDKGNFVLGRMKDIVSRIIHI